MDNRYSLNNLRDIVIPDPPPLWPPAPGTMILIALVALAIFYTSFLFYRNWKGNGYRRAGLQLLQDAVTHHDISITLKRVALAAFKREEVASLYGEEWLAFLNATCFRCSFPQSYQFSSNQTADAEERHLAATWIRYHRNQNRNGVETD